MKTYQIIIHGIGLYVEETIIFDDKYEKNIIIGFYTAKRIVADSEEEAFQKAENLVKQDDEFIQLKKRNLSNERDIKFENEEIYELSLWQKLFKRKPKGYIFY